MNPRLRTPAILAVALALALAMMGQDGCGTSDRGGGARDPTPTRLDGSESHEFEPADIARAESASEAVQDYCSGAVSEAQELGCLSHVDESDIP